MENLLALCFLLAMFLSSTECTRVRLTRNLTCLSCHLLSPPNFGCTDRDDTTEEDIKEGLGLGSKLWNVRGQDLVHKCVMCAIEDTWDLSKKELKGQRRKMCLATNLTEPGCSYIFPVGKDVVLEFCRCNTNKCNLGDITSIGGLKDINKFPSGIEVISAKGKNSGNEAHPNYHLERIMEIIIFRTIFGNYY